MKINFDEIFAVTAPGLEKVCADEISSLLARNVAAERGGVSFSGSLEDLYRVNLWSRVASRILVRVGSVKATDFPELHRKVKRLPWGRFVKPDTPIVVRSSSRQSRLNHTGRINETLIDAINGSLGRTGCSTSATAQTIIARFNNDSCQFSVDSSGELLHRRGYRTEVSQAPLRETLAAGILRLLGWDEQQPLYDPMCGSGTFLIEAALIAIDRAPGLEREFAFQSWPKYRAGLWNNILNEARRNERQPTVSLCGSDVDAEVVEVAKRNAERAGCADLINFSKVDIDDVEAGATSGMVVCNPPYGIRLGDESELDPLYQKIGALYSKSFKGWRGALFCPSEQLAKETGLNLKVVAKLVNGGVPTNLFAGKL